MKLWESGISVVNDVASERTMDTPLFIVTLVVEGHCTLQLLYIQPSVFFCVCFFFVFFFLVLYEVSYSAYSFFQLIVCKRAFLRIRIHMLCPACLLTFYSVCFSAYTYYIKSIYQMFY